MLSMHEFDAYSTNRFYHRSRHSEVVETGLIHSDILLVVICGTSVSGQVHRGIVKIGDFVDVLFKLVIFVMLAILELQSDLYLSDCGRGSIEAFQASDGSPLSLCGSSS